ncbi:acyltransferase-like protein [Geodermatophilus tzadiensis]|uniref:Acyltransferase-like protein n=1 Tax=Geodermatophilus tzadiensis TaxID=1137988 RepID=A0A2T0TSW4_9ACTN|nr:acyltransferase family protein [Geodermatophilus tzadiensis]PRY48741.1 acyltransferase-like protein [Geodermatophilus tzadiensis]
MATTAAETSGRVDRWPGLDLARAVVVGGLIPFHALLVFDATDDFYVKSERTADLLPIVAPVVVVAMPLLFLAAGIGTWHSWQAHGAGDHLRRRLRRLLVPQVVGTVLLVPLPVWLRLRADPGYTESYWAFWPRFFRVRWEWSEFPFVLQPAADGRGFETGHLWFLHLLLLYSLAVVPLLGWLGSAHGRRAVRALADGVGRRGIVLLPAVLLAGIAAGLGLDEGIAAGNVLGYLVFFAAGVVLATDVRFRRAVRRDAGPAAVAAVALLVGAGAAVLGGEADLLLDRDPLTLAGRAAFGAAGWCAVVAVLGGLARLRPPSGRAGRDGARDVRVVGYVTAAVLPWYVLHQPVLVAVAYLVVGSPLHPALEYLLICALSAVVTLLVYDLLVRRTALTRTLFGGA